jgi:hypothetical protein
VTYPARSSFAWAYRRKNCEGHIFKRNLLTVGQVGSAPHGTRHSRGPLLSSGCPDIIGNNITFAV